MWVTIGMIFAVFFCATVCGLSVYFLIPRSIEVILLPIVRENITFADDSSTHINFTIPLRLSNPNFYLANFTAAESEISFMTSQVGSVKDHKFMIIQKRTSEIWHNITCAVAFSRGKIQLKKHCHELGSNLRCRITS